MKLEKLLKGVEFELLKGNLDVDIANINYDNREIEKNGLFMCIEGLTVDGHDFVNVAINDGAVALIVQKEIEIESNDVSIIKISDSEKASAIIANNFFEYPSKKLNIAGFTGTNGKTTTTNLLATIIKKSEKKPGVIGTIENRIGEKVLETKHTTPDAFDLQKLFSEMVDEKVDYVSMEVSSHALSMRRVDGTEFNIGVFTNLTLDHLDYHKTMDEYLNAKKKLFMMSKIGLFNIDDEHSDKMMEDTSCKKYTFAIDNDADFKAENIVIDAHGVNFDLLHGNDNIHIELAIPGKFSVYNALAAASSAYLLGIPWNIIKEGLSSANGVKGRFESIKVKDNQDVSIIVDYAHAPDGLENVLNTITEFVKGNIYCVFGCGGDRDKSKRPVMGKIAGKYSDFCVITSDNPRTEVPEIIIDEIEVGMKETNCEYVRITDRKEGILYALNKSKKDDVILIAGKGHEDYQIIGKTKYHFDDAEIVREYLSEN